MIGVIFALALQATDATPAPPAPSNVGDAIADILAQTPPDEPAIVAPPKAPPAAVPAPAPVAAAPTPAPIQAPAPAYAPGDDPAARYASGVRSSFQARQARQGPLDGRWTLSDTDGHDLYVFQLADPGLGRGPVEGAWRDLGRQGAADAIGFLDAADRSGQGLILSFREARLCTVTLALGPDGRWTGQIVSEGHARPVVMTRS